MEYADLAALALLDQRTRCAMIRRLISQAARQSAQATRARVEHEGTPHGR
jgi:hypothetical protein